MAGTVRPDFYYDLSDIFPQATTNDSFTAASAAGSIERPSAYEPVVIACSTINKGGRVLALAAAGCPVLSER